MFEALETGDAPTDEAAMADRVAWLERLTSAAAAEQARLTARWDQHRRRTGAEAGVPTGKRGRGLAGEVALARCESPNQGGRHLGFARAWCTKCPILWPRWNRGG